MRRLQWDSSSEVVPIMVVTVLSMVIHSHLQDRLLRDFSFVLRRAQNPHLPENFLDDGGVLLTFMVEFQQNKK